MLILWNISNSKKKCIKDGGITIKTKKINQGSELLIPRNEWVPPKQIQGNDKIVLTSPIIKKAFQKILDLHKMKNDTCFVSLCTSTRPYSKSLKWKKFKESLDNIDLIVCSNGGIIPLEFENCYPYLTYDAHGERKYDNLYIKITYARLKLFFEKFPYKNIIFNFRPNLRNRICALKLKQEYKGNIYISFN